MFRYLVAALACVTFLLPNQAIAQGESPIEVTRMAEGLYRIETDAGAWTTSMVASVGSDGLLLVDSGEKEFRDGILRELEKLFPGKPTYILNTHAHVDHTGNNSAFGAEPVIVAHDIVRGRLRSGRYVIEEFPDEALPDITFTDSLTLYFNGEAIRLIATPGSHSDNDVIVHFVSSRVACLGDLAYGMHFPSSDNISGDVLRYADAVGRALDLLPVNVMIVSGHGRTCTVGEMREFQSMLAQTAGIVRDNLAAGKTVDELEDENILSEWAEYGEGYVSTDTWIRMLANRINGKKRLKSIFEPLYYALNAGGFDSLLICYDYLKRNHRDDYSFHHTRLYLFAIRVLFEREMYREAIKLLELNIEEHPNSDFIWAHYDAMGEAYLEINDTTDCIENYRKSLELNSDNTNAAEILERLGVK